MLVKYISEAREKSVKDKREIKQQNNSWDPYGQTKENVQGDGINSGWIMQLNVANRKEGKDRVKTEDRRTVRAWNYKPTERKVKGKPRRM